MIINKIEPQGFCGGVKNAIDIAKKAIKHVGLPLAKKAGKKAYDHFIIDEK